MNKISAESEISPDGDVSMGTLYELNKQAYNKVYPYNNEELTEHLSDIYEWVKEYGYQYTMLLCKERSDYTFFKCCEDKDRVYKKAILKDLRECLKNRGIILDISYQEKYDAWEIWIRIDGENFMFMFFEAKDFLIEVR